MSPLDIVLHTKHATTIPEDVRRRLMGHEGGYNKVTKDTGGVTRGGVAESSGVPAETIKKMGPSAIDKHWDGFWQRSGQHISDPVAAEYALNYAGNAGDPRFVQTLQRTLNRLQPDQPPLPENFNFGKQTKARLAALKDHTQLREPLLSSLEAHHKKLIQSNPGDYQKFQNGWKKRTDGLRGLMRPAASPVAPIPAKPSLRGTVKPVGPPLYMGGKFQTPLLVKGKLAPTP